MVRPEPGPVTNLFTRLFMGAGAEVTIRGGHLMLRPLTPVPVMRRGMRLHPDDDRDPYLFRVDFSGLGKGTVPVIFAGFDHPSPAPLLLIDGMALRKRPDRNNPRPWATAAVSAGTAALALRYRRRQMGPRS